VRHVWYVAYGSNLSRERFHHYLRGGRPHGNDREYPGCRDTSDPLDSFGLLIQGGVYFAGRSTAWRAGMAFYDPEAPGKGGGSDLPDPRRAVRRRPRPGDPAVTRDGPRPGARV
jgi:hypothetical protein